MNYLISGGIDVFFSALRGAMRHYRLLKAE
jgi:hypothetical protein